MKTMISEIKTMLDGISSVLEIAKEKISKHKDVKIDIIQTETHREKRIS